MRLRAATIGILAVLVASCALPSRQISAPAPVSPAVVQIWEYPAGDFPTMCIVMHADGVMQFRGGFKFFNPGAWRQGSKAGRLVITLGGDSAFPKKAAEQELRANPQTLVRFDAPRRELEFSIIGNGQRRIAVGGYYFYRSDTCGAD